ADNDWRLYINGILATSSTSSRSLSNTKKVGLCIGAEDQGSSGIANYFNGSMDEVGIWNRALTLTEISNLYNSGAGNTMIILPPTVTSINPTSVINNATQPITSIGGTNFGTEMGLVGLWHLNGNSTDSSGNSNNGTNTNITYGTGKFGQGANFNGSSSKINCGTGITINGNSCFTFSLWAKVNAFQSQDFFSYNINGTYDIKIQPYPGHVYFQRDDYYVDYTGFSDVTNFHLFTMTYDGTYIKAYIDGSQVGSQVSSTGSYTASNKTFYIGARTDNSMYFNGIIDEVRLYNRALSVTEIQALYNRNNLVQVQLTKSGQTAITCNSFTLTNSTTLSSGSCPVTGAAAGQWNVVVTNPDGGSGTLTNGFTINTPATIPALTSPTATLITSNSATLGANITSDGGATITTRGTCWGTSAAPTSNCIAEGGTSTGIFAHSRTGLPNFTLIYYRGYATNSVGTGYSADGSFTTTATPATVDWNNSNVQEITLTAARSFTFTNGKSGGVYSLLINQDATGGRAITWPSNVKWIGGTAPTFTTTANAVDVVRFIFNGTNYLAVGISLDIK
ncbi:MAG: hypothetical protein HGB12_11120, partial [Bacteroidetes bacterium]|nr:hypothetical protein [Bacteroidota bacterium]